MVAAATVEGIVFCYTDRMRIPKTVWILSWLISWLIFSGEQIKSGARWAFGPLQKLARSIPDDPAAVWEFFSGGVCIYLSYWITWGRMTVDNQNIFDAIRQNHGLATWAIGTFLIGVCQHAALFSNTYRMSMTILSTMVWFLFFIYLVLKQGLVMPTGIFGLATLAGAIVLAKFHEQGGEHEQRDPRQPDR